MMGDPELAAILKRAWPKPPVERIVHIDWLATATSIGAGRIKAGQHVARLECGHDAVTRAHKRTGCRTCHEMILAGEDYEAFRNRDRQDG